MQGVPLTKSGTANNLSVLPSNKLTSPCQLILITLSPSALAKGFVYCSDRDCLLKSQPDALCDVAMHSFLCSVSIWLNDNLFTLLYHSCPAEKN